MGRGAANVIKYGKIELTSTDEGSSMEELMKHLTKLLKDFGYPEADPEDLGEGGPTRGGDSEDDLSSGEELTEEQLEEALANEKEEAEQVVPEKPKPLAPWERVKMHGGEDPNSK